MDISNFGVYTLFSDVTKVVENLTFCTIFHHSSFGLMLNGNFNDKLADSFQQKRESKPEMLSCDLYKKLYCSSPSEQIM